MFAKLDKQIFKLVQQVKNHPEISTLQENFLAKFDDDQQKNISQVASVLLCILPLMLVVFLGLSNSSLSDRIELKSQTLTTIDSYLLNKNKIDKIGTRVISNSQYNDKKSFENSLSNISKSQGIDSGNVKVLNFDLPTKDGLKDVIASVEFKSLTTAQLMKYFEFLSSRTKAKFEKVLIEKDLTSNTVKGDFNIVFFQK